MTHDSGFECSAEWHLWEQPIAHAIYQKIGQITVGGKRPYFGLEQSLIDFFGMDYSAGSKRFRFLRDGGWLESLPLSQAEAEMKLTGVETDAALASLKRNRFQPKKYQWIHHDEWAIAHPGKCYVKPTFVWDNESLDPLGPMLFAVSEGLKWYPGLLVGPRAIYGSDEAVVEGFKAFVAGLPLYPVGRRAWKKAQGQFCHFCAEKRDNPFEFADSK